MASIGSKSPQFSTAKKREHPDDSLPKDIPDGVKKQRLIGPSLPPAQHTVQHSLSANSSSSSDDDDDDFGPALPVDQRTTTSAAGAARFITSTEHALPEIGSETLQREDWMLSPPSISDWSSKLDPTKLRSRKFHSGKNGNAPRIHNVERKMWTETAEEKRKRIEDEIMGVKQHSATVDTRQIPLPKYDSANKLDITQLKHNARFRHRSEIAETLMRT